MDSFHGTFDNEIERAAFARLGQVNLKMIRAKFKCSSVTKNESFDKSKGEFVYSAQLNPVTSGSPENQAFYAATPGGQIQLSSYVSDKFEVEKEYFVDFTPAN